MIEAFANLASASSLQLTRIFNPEGIVSSSPRVARNELPWVMSACAPQLRRSCAINRNNAMPQSLSAVYIHLVFSTKERRPFLRDKGSRKELDVEGYRINNPFHQ